MVRWSSSAAPASASSACAHGPGQVAARPARARPGRSRTAAGQAGELGLVEDDQVVDRSGQEPLDVVQPPVDAVELVARHQRADRARPRAPGGSPHARRRAASSTQRRMTASRRSRSSAGMASSTRSAARSTSPGGQRVPDGRLGVPGAVVPAAGPAMQPGDVAGALVEQVGAQHVGEQVVVAVPAAVVVERDDEQVLPLQRLEHRPARPVRAGDGVAQRPGQPVEDRGVEQEPAHARPAAGRAPRRRGSRRRTGRPRRSRR